MYIIPFVRGGKGGVEPHIQKRDDVGRGSVVSPDNPYRGLEAPTQSSRSHNSVVIEPTYPVNMKEPYVE